jgi:hypothetical protein
MEVESCCDLRDTLEIHQRSNLPSSKARAELLQYRFLPLSHKSEFRSRGDWVQGYVIPEHRLTLGGASSPI